MPISDSRRIEDQGFPCLRSETWSTRAFVAGRGGKTAGWGLGFPTVAAKTRQGWGTRAFRRDWEIMKSKGQAVWPALCY